MSAKEVHLEPWTEIIGKLGGISTDDDFIHVKIGDKVLLFAKESKESEIIQNKLSNALIGRKIGILRCDECPLLIRIVPK